MSIRFRYQIRDLVVLLRRPGGLLLVLALVLVFVREDDKHVDEPRYGLQHQEGLGIVRKQDVVLHTNQLCGYVRARAQTNCGTDGCSHNATRVGGSNSTQIQTQNIDIDRHTRSLAATLHTDTSQ